MWVIFGKTLVARRLSNLLDGSPGRFVVVPGRLALSSRTGSSRLRLSPPAAVPDVWWELYRSRFDVVASIGSRYTSTPTQAWFAIWEGHGFVPPVTRLGWRNPPVDDAERQRREERREQQHRYDRERAERIGPALAAVPRFELPHRTYYLVRGALSAISELRYPGVDGWRNPDLFWPDDRSWFAATDVEFLVALRRRTGSLHERAFVTLAHDL